MRAFIPEKHYVLSNFMCYVINFKSQLQEKIRPVAQGVERPIGFFPAADLKTESIILGLTSVLHIIEIGVFKLISHARGTNGF